jgi:hypothetical protein
MKCKYPESRDLVKNKCVWNEKIGGPCDKTGIFHNFEVCEVCPDGYSQNSPAWQGYN